MSLILQSQDDRIPVLFKKQKDGTEISVTGSYYKVTRYTGAALKRKIEEMQDANNR